MPRAFPWALGLATLDLEDRVLGHRVALSSVEVDEVHLVRPVDAVPVGLGECILASGVQPGGVAAATPTRASKPGRSLVLDRRLDRGVGAQAHLVYEVLSALAILRSVSLDATHGLGVRQRRLEDAGMPERVLDRPVLLGHLAPSRRARRGRSGPGLDRITPQAAHRGAEREDGGTGSPPRGGARREEVKWTTCSR